MLSFPSAAAGGTRFSFGDLGYLPSFVAFWRFSHSNQLHSDAAPSFVHSSLSANSLAPKSKSKYYMDGSVESQAEGEQFKLLPKGQLRIRRRHAANATP